MKSQGGRCTIGLGGPPAKLVILAVAAQTKTMRHHFPLKFQKFLPPKIRRKDRQPYCVFINYRERIIGGMESDDDFELFSSPKEEAFFPVYERKLKRLKKAVRVSQDSHLDQSDGDPFMPEAISPKYGAQDVQESDELLQSRSGSEDFSDENAMGSGFTGLCGDGDGSGARRALDFEVSGDELDENGEDREKEIQEESGDVSMEEEKGEDRKKGIQEESGDGSMEDEKGKDRKKEIHEESGDASMEALEKKRRSPDDLEEKKNKKKRTEDKESAAIKRRMEKVCRLFMFYS